MASITLSGIATCVTWLRCRARKVEKRANYPWYADLQRGRGRNPLLDHETVLQKRGVPDPDRDCARVLRAAADQPAEHGEDADLQRAPPADRDEPVVDRVGHLPAEDRDREGRRDRR